MDGERAICGSSMNVFRHNFMVPMRCESGFKRVGPLCVAASLAAAVAANRIKPPFLAIQTTIIFKWKVTEN